MNPLFFVWDHVQGEKKRKKKTKQKSGNMGNMGVRCAKNKKTERAVLQRAERQAIGKAWSTPRVKNKQDRMNQEQSSRVRVTWVKQKTKKCAQFSEIIVCYAVLLPALLYSCLGGSFFHWPLLSGLIHTSSTFLACAGVYHGHRNLNPIIWSNPDY